MGLICILLPRFHLHNGGKFSLSLSLSQTCIPLHARTHTRTVSHPSYSVMRTFDSIVTRLSCPKLWTFRLLACKQGPFSLPFFYSSLQLWLLKMMLTLCNVAKDPSFFSPSDSKATFLCFAWVFKSFSLAQTNNDQSSKHTKYNNSSLAKAPASSVDQSASTFKSNVLKMGIAEFSLKLDFRIVSGHHKIIS